MTPWWVEEEEEEKEERGRGKRDREWKKGDILHFGIFVALLPHFLNNELHIFLLDWALWIM